MSGSTKRPETPAPKPDDEPEARPSIAEPSPEPEPRPDRGSADEHAPRSPLEGLAGPIDLRSRAATASQSGARAAISSAGSGTGGRRLSASATGPFPVGSHWSKLVDSLVGDLLLSHVPGRRVLDLGYGSPEIAEWVRDRVGDHLSIVEKGALEQAPGPIADASGFLPASEFLDAEGNLLIPHDDEEPPVQLREYRDASFDVIYCLRTFPHLGFDTESSERLGRELLREAARVTVDGGTVFVQIANPRSLRGFIEGIRNPITVVSRRRMILGDRYGLTRWDTLSRFLRFVPPELEFVRVHGLGVLIPHNATLEIPVVGRVLERLEWRTRDLGVVRRFGAQLLVVLRRLHRSDPSLHADGPQRSTLSSSLLEALSSGSRSVGIKRADTSEASEPGDDAQKNEPPSRGAEPE